MAATKIDDNLLQYMVQGVKDYAIFALDPEGNIASWNAGAERIKGYHADEAVGQHFSIFYTEEAKAVDHPGFELKEAIDKGSYEEEGWRVRKNGARFWASVTITAIFNENKELLGFAKVTRDLTERRKAQEASAKTAEALQTSEEIFNSTVAVVKDYAIFMLDPKGNVRTWNEGAQRIKGYTAAEIVGKHFSVFYMPQAVSSNHPAHELEQAIKNGSYQEEGWRVKKDGSLFWASVTITALTKDGELQGFLKVTRDMTEKRADEKALEHARDEAIMANQLKSKFVANITHEIRTPLTGIVGLSQLIAEAPSADADLHDSGVRIFEASKQLLLILNDLLDFAKLEAGKMEIENVEYNVADILDQVHGLTRRKAEQKSLQYRFDVDSNLPGTIIGDSNKVRQILLNLVSNAIKFTEQGAVQMSAEKQDDNIVYSVTDTGIGIAEEVQHKLFKPFAQADHSTTRLFGGTGLGLSIAQQFVELMDGEIGINSQSGRGTTVWFSLPLHQGSPQ